MGHSHHHHLGFDLGSIDPLAFAGFAAVFSYSFLLSWHCIGMCGPLACSVLARARPRLGWATLLYNLGRVISYSLAGALVGFVSQQISSFSFTVGAWLAMALGVLLIIWALAPWMSKRFRVPGSRSLYALHSYWQQRFQTQKGLGPSFLLGLLTVLLPCMTLHPLLLAAAGTQSALSGASTMLAFSLGTLPAMASATYMPTLVTGKVPSLWFTRLGKLFLVFAGILTIWRAWSGLGTP